VVVVVVGTIAATVVSGAAGAETTGAGAVAVGDAAAAATTDTDCDVAAAVYASLPAWLAEITHVPAELNVTTPAATEQTVSDWFAIEIVAARNAVLSTDTVYELPTVAGDGGVERNEIVWVILSTVTDCVSLTGR
jgi:hypothetical protein